MLTIYSTPLSANGRKVLAVSHHLRVPADIKTINVYTGEGRTPEYLAINPSGKIPTLVDGDLTLWESNAILQYLSEACGDFELWSREPRQRADISRWLYWEASQWQPTLIPVLSGVVGRLLVPQLATAAAVEANWGDQSFQTLVRFLNQHLNGRAFMVGDGLTLADFAVGAMMMYFRRAEFPFDDFVNIATWYARLEDVPAWKATAVGPWAY